MLVANTCSNRVNINRMDSTRENFIPDYSDILVRVTGYSDYFNELGPELQEEIIRRTEHDGT
jgi:pyruvate-formate lyase